MTDGKKRIPWWVLACAVLLVVLGAVMGFIETAGRSDTLTRRYDQIEPGMDLGQVLELLDRDSGVEAINFSVSPELREMTNAVAVARGCEGRAWEEGPFKVMVWFDSQDLRVLQTHSCVAKPTFWWRTRRWAEQAYMAIHGPRR